MVLNWNLISVVQKLIFFLSLFNRSIEVEYRYVDYYHVD